MNDTAVDPNAKVVEISVRTRPCPASVIAFPHWALIWKWLDAMVPPERLHHAWDLLQALETEGAVLPECHYLPIGATLVFGRGLQNRLNLITEFWFHDWGITMSVSRQIQEGQPIYKRALGHAESAEPLRSLIQTLRPPGAPKPQPPEEPPAGLILSEQPELVAILLPWESGPVPDRGLEVPDLPNPFTLAKTPISECAKS